jgi:hypothetical protein
MQRWFPDQEKPCPPITLACEAVDRANEIAAFPSNIGAGIVFSAKSA